MTFARVHYDNRPLPAHRFVKNGRIVLSTRHGRCMGEGGGGTLRVGETGYRVSSQRNSPDRTERYSPRELMKCDKNTSSCVNECIIIIITIIIIIIILLLL